MPPRTRTAPAVTATDVAAPPAGAVHYAPAGIAHQVGGDLHAVAESPYGLRVLIGDVRGRDTLAAGGANALLGAFHRAGPRARTPYALVDELERAMLRHTGRHRGPAADEDFASVIVAQFSPDAATLLLVNRGHPAPLLLRPGSVRALEPRYPGLPLGLRELAPRRAAVTLSLRFPADGTLLLLTDGTTEARNPDGAFYDPVARLAAHGGAAPEELVRLLRADVTAHLGGPGRRRDGATDDMAVLALRPARQAVPQQPEGSPDRPGQAGPAAERHTCTEPPSYAAHP